MNRFNISVFTTCVALLSYSSLKYELKYKNYLSTVDDEVDDVEATAAILWSPIVTAGLMSCVCNLR